MMIMVTMCLLSVSAQAWSPVGGDRILTSDCGQQEKTDGPGGQHLRG